MKEVNGFSQWQFAWGCPRSLFVESEGRKLEIAFLLALVMHITPFGYIWHRQLLRQEERIVTLQNVDLIEPEIEKPPPVVVEKPKSALEFLKMALPIFRKPVLVPETPRDILPAPKSQEAKLAEPEKLIERKMPAAPALPEIKLDSKNAPAPKAIDFSKLPQKKSEPVSREPALKLEEVGKKAVALPQTPAISLDRDRRVERIADLTTPPKTGPVPQPGQNPERLIEKTAPVSYKPASQKVLGYERRDAGAVSLDQPREIVRTTAKPKIETLPKAGKKDEPAGLQISKERVKITGPLEKRKVIKYFVPEYPAWARERNIEANVTIRFMVSPDGIVRENAVVEITSGHQALDKLAMESLRKWLFSKLDNETLDQWGVITFRFLLD